MHCSKFPTAMCNSHKCACTAVDVPKMYHLNLPVDVHVHVHLVLIKLPFFLQSNIPEFTQVHVSETVADLVEKAVNIFEIKVSVNAYHTGASVLVRYMCIHVCTVHVNVSVHVHHQWFLYHTTEHVR